MTINPEPIGVGSVVKSIATTVVANEVYFGDLDAVVGDGDFGYSLARGFEQVLATWDDLDPSEAGPFLHRVGLIITSHVGGTSGPIWGTAAIRAARVASQNAEIDGAVVADMLDAAVDGIRARGAASVGDKTLLDALVPAVEALRAALEASEPGDQAVDAMARAARQGAESTRAMQARRGRASYAGERSIGSYDAGAVAVAVLLEDLAASWPRTP
jgi:dihydroxyacetone kinase phosphoprotein-dependent L subunit